jgi:hypothetical protein
MKIGRRHIFDGNYASARETILKGYAMVEDNEKVQSVMKEDDYARLLEWAGMVKHWAYELDAAIDCYRKCAELEPINVSLYTIITICYHYLCSNYNFYIFEGLLSDSNSLLLL